MPPLIRAQSCRSCKFKQDVEAIASDGSTQKTGQMQCAFNPPVPFILPGEHGPQCVSQFPPVSEALVCGRYVQGILKAELN